MAPPTTTCPIEALVGPTLYMKKKTKDNQNYTLEPCKTKDVIDNKNTKKQYVLLYFSASWCPPCQSFTPILADFYQQYSNVLDIIYIPSDRTKDEFINYYTKKMPWYTLHPFLDQNDKNYSIEYNMNDIRSKLGITFQIKGIPTLIVLERKSGLFITNVGRTDIMSNPSKKVYNQIINKWNTIVPISIEEGIRKANQIYDGTIYSIIKFIINWLLQNPLYILGFFYVTKLFFSKSKSTSTIGGSNNNMAPGDDALLQPVPEDEF